VAIEDWGLWLIKRGKNPWIQGFGVFILSFTGTLGLVSLVSDTGYSEEISEMRERVYLFAAVIGVVAVSVWAMFRWRSRIVGYIRNIGRWMLSNWQLVTAVLFVGAAIAIFFVAGLYWPLLLVMLALVPANALFTLWLYSVSQRKKVPAEKSLEMRQQDEVAEIFREDFHNLDNWMFQQGWSIEGGVLRVTNSGHGGIAKPCLTWSNYVFEFDTKIESKYSGWIVRAQSLADLVMLQCRLDEIRPCFRASNQYDTLGWTDKNIVPLPQSLELNTWYHVQVKIEGAQVDVTIEGENIAGGRMEIKDIPPLEHPEGAVNYSVGSIGFRESGDECAYFRNVVVKRLR
jgi:hypothetical protein